jgi:DNA-binding LacI/PurR family transcriptional regulator
MTEPANGANKPSMSRAATIYDVARRAGVSHQTVSRLLSGFEGIRPETRAKVEKALRELDYRPNFAARSLTMGRSYRIGALTHEIDKVGPSRIIQGAATAARRAGYVLDIVTLDMADEKAIAESLDLIRQQDLAGVVVFASTDEMIAAFRKSRFRVPVHLSIDGEGRGESTVQRFMLAEIEMLVDLLWQDGHRQFAHIAGPANWPAARNREFAYEQALARRGVQSLRTVRGDWSPEAGYRAVADLPGEATAIIVANDQMALGALLALQKAGAEVPADVSVTGIDDTPESAYFSPPLTTVRLDFMTQGGIAVAELLALIGEDVDMPTMLPRPQLVVRASTGSAPIDRRRTANAQLARATGTGRSRSARPPR